MADCFHVSEGQRGQRSIIGWLERFFLFFFLKYSLVDRAGMGSKGVDGGVRTPASFKE